MNPTGTASAMCGIEASDGRARRFVDDNTVIPPSPERRCMSEEAATSLSTDDVRSMYERSFPLHERRWEREGHRSYHHGYYRTPNDDPADAIRRMTERVADAVDVGPGDRVLDLGCGVGGNSRWLAEHGAAAVVGVNVHDRQLEFAKRLTEAAGLEDVVTYRSDDFHELATIDQGSVDVVWGLEALCHSRDDSAVVDASMRALGDGGRIVFADIFQRQSPPSDDDRLDALYASWDVRYDPIDDLEAALTDRGFTDVETVDCTNAVAPSIERAGSESRYGRLYYRLLSMVGRADDRMVELATGGYHCQRCYGDLLGYYITSARLEP